jgi:hypothetical protein
MTKMKVARAEARATIQTAFCVCVNQLQPLVVPHDGHAWQEPARCMVTPHCMHIGAS